MLTAFGVARLAMLGCLLLVVWVVTGTYPLVEVRKGADFVLGCWPLFTAYRDPFELWPFIVTHLLLSVVVTAGLAGVVWTIRCALVRRGRRP